MYQEDDDDGHTSNYSGLNLSIKSKEKLEKVGYIGGCITTSLGCDIDYVATLIGCVKNHFVMAV